MADAQKSIQVNIEVVINQAKKALGDIASTTQKATDQLSKMGDGAKNGSATLDKATKSGSQSVSAFFSSQTKDFVKGLAIYDLFKEGVHIAFDALKEGITGAMDDYKALGQTQAIIEAQGLSWEKVGGKIEAFAQSMHKFGFDVEDTEKTVASFSQLLGGDVDKSMKVAKLAADLTSSGYGTMQQNVDNLSKVLAGRGTRALMDYNVAVQDGASVTEQLAAIQKRATISTEAWANTLEGKMAIAKNSINDVEKAVGQGLIIAFDQFLTQTGFLNKDLSMNEDSLHAISKAAYQAGNAIAFLFDGVKMIIVGLGGLVDALALGAAKIGEWSADATLAIEKVKGVFGKANKDTVTMMQEQQKEFIAAGDILKNKLSVDMDNAGKTAEAMGKAWKQAGGEGFDSASAAAAKAETQLGKLGGTTSATKEQLQAMSDAQKEAKASADALANSVGGIKQKMNEFTFAADADFTRFSALLKDTKAKQDDWTKTVGQGFDAIATKVKSTSENVKTLTDKLNDAKKSFQDFLAQTAKDSGDNFAQIVHDAEKAIPDLQKQITSGQSKGEDVSDLQKQLADKQAVVASAQQTQYQSNAEFLSQLAFLRSQDNKNELDQAYAVMQQKIDAKKKETDEQLAQIQKQIDAATAERDFFLAAQTAMTQAFDQNVKIRQKTASTEMSTLSALTASINVAADAYFRLAAAASAASSRASVGTSSPSGARASGGVVSPGQAYLVGEDGPEIFQPNSGGSILPNRAVASGDNIQIIIQGPVVRQDSDISAIAAAVMDIMSRRDELARFGTYK